MKRESASPNLGWGMKGFSPSPDLRPIHHAYAFSATNPDPSGSVGASDPSALSKPTTRYLDMDATGALRLLPAEVSVSSI